MSAAPMTPERWDQVRELLAEALELEASERLAFLQKSCVNDQALVDEVQSLLEAHARAGDFLSSTPSPSELCLTEGARLGPYQIVGFLGSGGMGEVYRARDTRLGREVALKVLPESTQPERVIRFEREARALAALAHPHILAIHDVGSEGGVQYLVTELLEGETLRQRLTRGRLRVSHAVELARQAAEALSAAHERGIVHRDLKPTNLLLVGDVHLKLLDFGLARLTQDADEKDAEPDMGRSGALGPDPNPLLTATGERLGTVGYMAPEQVACERVDHRGDIFALGVVLHEMLTATPPFRRETVEGTLRAILYDDPAPLGLRGERRLEAVVRRCLEKRRDARFQSANDLAAALRAVATHIHTPLGRRQVLGGLAATATVVALGLTTGWRAWRSRVLGSGTVAIDSIAVLPLLNLSRDIAQEYFADGMTEALIAALGKIKALAVTSRTSVMQYKGVRRQPKEIAQELGVDAIVEGTVLVAGDRVRITVRLIEPTANRHLWAQTYERHLRDILSLQGDVARAIAGEIRIILTPQEAHRLGPERRVDPRAYDVYLKGRYHSARFSGDGAPRALQFYQQAVEIDPTLAEAYAGLAEIYAVHGTVRLVPRMTWPAAREKTMVAVHRALELDPTLSEAHTALGLALMLDWEWAASEREFRQALELNPNSDVAHQWYAQFLRQTGRLDEGLAVSRRAERLNPLDLLSKTIVGWLLWNARRYDEALDQWDRVLELNPDYGLAVYNRGLGYVLTGRYEEAVAAARRAITLMGEDYIYAETLLGVAYAGVHRRRDTLAILDRAKRGFGRGPTDPITVAWLYLALGEQELALDWFESAYQARNPWLPNFTSEPHCDPLRSNPRFKSLRQGMGLS